MMPNNPDLGDDTLPEESLPDTEHTTAAPQEETPEMAADMTQPESNVEAPSDEDEAEEQNSAVSVDASSGEDEAEEQDSAISVDAQPDEDETPEQDSVASVEAQADEDEAEEQDSAVSVEAPSDEDEAEEQDTAASVDAQPDEDETQEQDSAASDTDKPEETGGLKAKSIVEGTVLETSPTEVLVDLGDDVTGVIASRELERMDRVALEALKPGNPVIAYVLKARGSDGRPVLSLARAEEERNWQMAEDYHQSQDVYYSKVAGYNKGGLIVRFGKVRGFVPASQVSRERQRRAEGENPEARWGEMVGEDIAVKVVEIDRARNRLILSERAAAREWREQQKGRLLDELEVGDVRKGRVISLADFGAFVDLGGADGLIHLTELSWEHVTHPRELLEVGQEVEVEVISLDRQRKRIGLSLKRKAHDPWEDVLQQYEIGQLVQASVTKLTKFGAFARLVDSPEIEGLIHISELADYRVSHPREVVLVGDVLTLRIVKIDPEQRRLGLSLRQVDSAKFMDQDWDALVDEFEPGAPGAVQQDAASAEDAGAEEAEEESTDDDEA
ncbi:30S ribosomal protein S1 [Aggregatilinea lenta]|uniref:30S ribosomal protein S1 n=1 Tax=Aggregatilinea lenta TaxID=913108 RepID=UPI000E5AA36F|nr:S1 RNA-binding domain-containing protein [Aggregatilinea lenta]